MSQQSVLQAQGNLLFRMCSLFEDIPNAPIGRILLHPLHVAVGLSTYFLPFTEWDSRTISCGFTSPLKGTHILSEGWLFTWEGCDPV